MPDTIDLTNTNTSKDKPAELSGLQIYLRLLSYLKRYIFIFLLSVAGLWLFSVMQIAFIDLFGYLINVLSIVTGETVDSGVMNFESGDGGMTAKIADYLVANDFIGGEDTLAQTAIALPVMMMAIALVRGIGFLVGNYGMSYVALSVIHDLRNQVFEKYTRMPPAYFDGNMSGHMVAQLTFHVNQVMGATTSALKVILREGFLVIGLLGYLFYLNWRLALMFLAVMPFIALIISTVSKRFRRLSKKIQTAVGDITHVASEAVNGYREMHLFGGKEYESARLFKASQANRRQNLKLDFTQGLSTPIIQLLLTGTMGMLVWFALRPEMLNDMTTSGFIKFLFAAAMLAKPMRQLTQVNNVIQRGIAAAGELFHTLDAEEEVDTGTYEVERVEGNFVFEHVGFRYDTSNQPVLDEINFSVNSGETIALVGSSGSGKTSLVNLIPRFYNYQQGRVLLDGRELTEYTLRNLRQQIALVSQSVTLFNDSIYNNIAYGELGGASLDAVREAARMAQALEFIEALPEGFNTTIGDDGVLLSGGQRQRLAIARALLKDAPILILDEATSALDTESERHIQAALDVAMEGRTTFVIAHRLSTIENADRILVMERGRILETGSHDQLLAAGGRYANLHHQGFVEPTVAGVSTEASAVNPLDFDPVDSNLKDPNP
ncbi:MAG: lipid A export permease/ATP-binding protein MsbA [Porticoccaceae bacterium]